MMKITEFILFYRNSPYVNVVVNFPFGSKTVATGALKEPDPYRDIAASRFRGSPDGTTSCSPTAGVMQPPIIRRGNKNLVLKRPLNIEPYLQVSVRLDLWD